ncbi:hypothetical protein TH66_15650 [Carbonactinospora thermoautotrophica]|uniref:Endonuclease/exonuclease/phosphatase domain-containing protein n=2 Tax=Carbonactinospora thermoautotrophica TaxID=1469144 RepID=A0A132MS70_9ACTN|nr:hypothetical protein TH66_15650 [Carbonactinospora thermoautotrophica]KWX08926.1 hypothetical protein TR74_12710 [Carbonactinospora thermoautotrophica]
MRLISMRPAEIRVLTYNVRALRDDKAAVAGVIRACAPDVVCVQEAPCLLRWRHECAELARESGLVVITGGRPASGNLLLGSWRTKVIATRNARLTRTRGLDLHRSQPLLERRGLAMAVLKISGVRVGFVGLHLGLDAGERARHVAEVFGHVQLLRTAYQTEHLVLAGDVNELPHQYCWIRFCVRFVDCAAVAGRADELTFPAVMPDRRIDGIFASQGLQVVDCRVVDLPEVARASDHRPVLAVLRVPA